MTRRPRIGLSLDSEEDGGGYSKMPWYALRRNYCDAVAAAGGLPLALPHEAEAVAAYLDLLDGVVITGGNFDVDPALFGAESRHSTVQTKDRRTRFELALVQGALQRDMPVLGICGGQQLLNVVLGGTLIQHVPEAFPDGLAHEQPNPRTEPGHAVTLEAGTLLHRICGTDRMQVNSAHHQAADQVGDGVVINARAEDGVIEGIEAPAYRFCLGVEWHPEFHIDAADAKIFSAFTEAAGAA
jgi:putative glutamine amidotransferase